MQNIKKQYLPHLSLSKEKRKICSWYLPFFINQAFNSINSKVFCLLVDDLILKDGMETICHGK